MASVVVMTTPPTDIDYSLGGRVRSFDLRGDVLYDEAAGIAVDGWEARLAEFVKEQGLDVDDGRGLHAFVYGLIERGLIADGENARRQRP